MRRHRRHISPNHPSLRRRATETVPAPAPTPPQRALHLVDIDNLLGDPTVTDPERIDLVLRSYRHAARFTEGDHAVVATGTNAEHVLAVELAWPGVQHRRCGGPDGADLALLEAAGWAAATRRYARVVIGSGDRIFLAALDQLRAADIHVEVVARGRGLATALAVRARGCVQYLREPTLAAAS